MKSQVQSTQIKDINTAGIIGHLVHRHRTFLWALAFFVSNALWIVFMATDYLGR